VTGFGFNDDHLSEPILAAVRTNPHLRLIIINPSADDFNGASKEKKQVLGNFVWFSQAGRDVWLINANVRRFC